MSFTSRSLASNNVVTWEEENELFASATSAVLPNVRIEKVIVAVDGEILVSAKPETEIVTGVAVGV